MHFRPPAVDALRQVCGAKMGPTVGAVARFGATAASSHSPMRGSWMPAFGSRAFAVTSWGCRPLSSPARCIEDRLEERFDKFRPRHAGSSTGLFRDWKTYQASLPVRAHDGEETFETLKLHTLPYCYWGSDVELCTMVTQLESKGCARGTVKYVCAPSASGKTTSIVPAFLKSDKFTHYLYLAFHNNGRRNFKLRPSKPDEDEDVAEKQGAAFAVECVRILLEEPDTEGPYPVPRDDDPPPITDSQAAVSELVEKHLGKGSRSLIHVDEHRKMCARDKDTGTAGPGARFSRWAMQCLAAVAGSTVATTFTDPPPLESDKSSAVRRAPVVKPGNDIDRSMEYLGNHHPVAILHSEKFPTGQPKSRDGCWRC